MDLATEGVRAKVLLTSECVREGSELLSPVRGLPTLYDNRVLCVRFRDPVYPDSYIFPAKK